MDNGPARPPQVSNDERSGQSAARHLASGPVSLAARMRADVPCLLPARRRTGSAGADRGGGTASFGQCHGHHARGGGPRDPGDLGVRLVVSVIQSPRPLQPESGARGADRVRGLVDPGADRDPTRRGDLDRLASAGPAGENSGECRAAPGGGRRARLEMAVHLPRSWHRRRQPAGHSGRNPGQLPAHLGDRDEFLSGAAARQPDLCDGRHDHAPQPARRRAGPIPRTFGQFQRRRLFRHAVRGRGGGGRRFHGLGRALAQRRARAR